jgi:uncharacterized membrane protein
MLAARAYVSPLMPASESGESRLERLVYLWSFAGVYAAAVGSIAWLWWSVGGRAVADLGKLAAMSLFLFGKFVVFAPDEVHGQWSLALMVWLIDLLVAFALASFLDSFERLPMLGRWLRRARRRAVEVLAEYPRLERMAFFGVAILVLLPIASTGAVTGSFAARLLGLSRLAGVLAIALGSAGTATIFALLATLLGDKGEEVLRSPLTSGSLLAGGLVLAWLAFRKVKALLRR